MNRNYNNINLICFPYAGGSKYSYLSLESIAPPNIKFIPIEPPGRGDRLMEPLLLDINSMVEDLFNQIIVHIDKPYVIFGHSMGALLGYLVAKKIEENNFPLPQRLIVTGCEGPSVKDENKKLRSTLPPDKFIEELKILGGIPNEVFEDASFINFFEPILRADFKAIEDYKYLKRSSLNVPFTVLFGSDEDFSFEEAFSWQDESNFEVDVIQLPGDHFFIFKHEKQIIDLIQKKMRPNSTQLSKNTFNCK
ncbi:thioesterase II family protein [Mucilaginibacter lappiensis]|uniref:Surfactin synthase thioesterase subunit n=1 Tax=Mucilaginibacter lappiensis TaxID=354630 RepID=A0A841JNH6_9SPHI|nr:thioesterase [Mucilaginibacter lappiensis]MBB6131822.1 surfactin synthase thioesterase subunit [Mucilaginibacter lappiensis]